MSNTKVAISQGDSVYFYDTSTGNVVSRQWYFPGGSPTGGTNYGVTVQYNSVNVTGYDASITISDGGIFDTDLEKNLISVYPESLDLSLSIQKSGIPISTSRMSSDVNFIATGGTGSGISVYTWVLPGTGSTGTVSTVTTNLYNWLTLTGSEYGATYSTYTSNANVSVLSRVNNIFNASGTLTYIKAGISEFLNLATYPSGAASHYVSRFSGTILAGESYNTNIIGMQGNGFILEVTQPEIIIFNNTSFRAHGERLYLYSPSFDLVSPNGANYGLIWGQVIASSYAFNRMSGFGSLVATMAPYTRFTQGNYMFPGDIHTIFSNKFYFADTSNQLVDLGNIRYWSNSAITTLIRDNSFGTATSRGSEIAPYQIPGIKYSLNGGYSNSIGGPCLPASALTPSDSDVYLYVSVYVSEDQSFNSNLAYSFSCLLSSGGDPGNSPDGLLIMAQDTVDGNGIVTSLNYSIGINNLSLYIESVADGIYTPFETLGGISDGGNTDSTEFYGIRISVKDDYISSALIGNAGPYSGTSLNGKYITYITVSGNNGDWPYTEPAYQWLGLYVDTIANPYQWDSGEEPRRGWSFEY